LPGLTLAGIGAGISNPVLADLTLSSVPPEQSGVASGTMDAFRQVGIAVGVAGFGAIDLAHGQQRLTATVGLDGPTARTLLQAASSGHLRASGALAAAGRAAFVSGFNEILIVGAGVALVGAVLTLILVRSPATRPVAVAFTAQ